MYLTIKQRIDTHTWPVNHPQLQTSDGFKSQLSVLIWSAQLRDVAQIGPEIAVVSARQ
jgi:hypothetical protein